MPSLSHPWAFCLQSTFGMSSKCVGRNRDDRHLSFNHVCWTLERFHKLFGEGNLCIPTSLSDAPTSIDEEDGVNLCVQACQCCVVDSGHASVLGTLSIFKALWTPAIGALACSSCSLDNISGALS